MSVQPGVSSNNSKSSSYSLMSAAILGVHGLSRPGLLDLYDGKSPSINMQVYRIHVCFSTWCFCSVWESCPEDATSIPLSVFSDV